MESLTIKQRKLKSLKGFTINELIVVLIIISVLILLALPSLLPLITKAKTTEAKLALKHLHTLQQAHFYTYSKFTNDLKEIGYEQNTLVTDGGNANYQIEIVEANPSGYIARATAVVDFDQDGTFNVWEVNQNNEIKEVIAD